MPGLMRIELAQCLGPRDVRVSTLELGSGATVGDALSAAGVAAEGLRVGVWGRLVAADHALRDGDRIEIYRPLVADPKESRRLRYRAQHTRPKRR